MSHACHRFWQCYKTLTFCSLLTRCTIPCACHAKRHLNVQKCSESLVFWTFWLWNVLRATTACTFSTSQLPKVVRTWCALCILTSKCASRHNGVLFRLLNFQKWSGAGDFLCILASKCASGHNYGVQFFISHLASGLRTRRFSEPTFRSSPGSSFFWDFLFFDLLSSSLLFSDSSHLSFSFVHIVGSLTSKLPSMNTFRNAIQNPPKLWTFRTSKLQVLVPHDASMLWTCCHCLSSSAAQMGKHCFYLFLVHVNGTVNAKMATRTTKSPPSRVGLSSLASFVNFVRQSPWLQQQPSCLHSLVGRNTWNRSDS